MKNVSYLAIAIAACTLTFGCSNKNENTSGPQDASFQRDSSAGSQKIAEYRQSIQTQIDSWDRKLADWKTEAAAATAETKAEMQTWIDKVEVKLRAAKERLAEAKNSTASSWESFKLKLDQAVEDLKQGFSDAASHFKG